MRHTGNPLAYTFARPQAKRVLYLLERDSPQPYSHVREQVGVDPKTFQRITKRLAQFNLLHQRAPEDAEWENDRIRIVLELTGHGEEVLSTLHDLDHVLEDHAVSLGPGMTEPLLVGAG
jgi:DNA-binding MarR family transcriptional regulator